MKKFFLVTNDFVNSRLDRWFRKNVCDVPQSLIEKNIRKGYIKVNHKREKSSYKLKKSDQILTYNINFKTSERPSLKIANTKPNFQTKMITNSISFRPLLKGQARLVRWA